MNVGWVRSAMLLPLLLAGCGTYGRDGRLTTASSLRASEAVSIFATYCLKTPPSLRDIDRRAVGLPVFVNRPIGAGAQQKGWLVPMADGPILLTVEGSADDSLNTVVCGVAAAGASALDLQRQLSLNARLILPVQRAGPAPGGGSLVVWTALFGDDVPLGDAQVMLTVDAPGLGVNPINLTLRRHRIVPGRVRT
jgi:hypothetical protein